MFKGPYTDLPFRLFEDDTTNLLWNRINSGGARVKYFNQHIYDYDEGYVGDTFSIVYDDNTKSYTVNGSCATRYNNLVAKNLFFLDNHKYLFLGAPANSSATNKKLYLYSLDGGTNYDIYDDGRIISIPSNHRYYLYISLYPNVQFNNIVFTPRIIDLTDIFGYGNEPTTATDPRLDAVKAYAAKHGEYKPSSWFINGVQWTYGACRLPNGNITRLTSCGCALSDYFDVSTYKNITCNIGGNNTVRYCFFDEDKNFISATSIYSLGTVTIPFDAEYCDITAYCDDYSTTAIKPNNVAAITNIFNYADIPYYNQLYKYTYPKTTSSGITCEPLGNGKYSVKGTAAVNVWLNINSSNTLTEKDHTYLVTGNPLKGTNQSVYDMCLYVDKIAAGTQRLDVGYGAITKGNGQMSPFYIKISAGATVDCIVEPRLIDITDIYGYGNEPVGGNEATDDRVKELRRYAKAHWEYNEGSWVYDGVHWGRGMWRDGTTGEITAVAGSAASAVLSTEDVWRIARRINKNVIYNTAIVFYDADMAITAMYNSNAEIAEWTVPDGAAYYRLFMCRVNFDLPINPDYLDEVKFVALSEDFEYYNQLYNPEWEQPLPVTSNGCTWTKNDDGSLHVEGTLTDYYTSWYPMNFSLGGSEKAKQIIDHHVYLVPVEYNVQQATAEGVNSNQYKFMKNLIKTDAARVCFYGAVTGEEGQYINTNVARQFIVDLTNLFGYGQEPISYADTRIKMLAKYLEIRGNDYVANPGATPDGVGLTRKAWIKHITGQPVEITTHTGATYGVRNYLQDISEYAGGDMRRSDTSGTTFSYYYVFADKDKKFIDNGYGYIGRGAHVAIPYNACYVMFALTSVALAPNITDDLLTFTKADVKWNQISKVDRTSLPVSYAGITLNKYDETGFTLSGTATATSYIWYGGKQLGGEFKYIAGHKYYMSCENYKLNGLVLFRGNGPSKDGQLRAIATAADTMSETAVRFISGETYTTDYVYHPIVVDLTAMGWDDIESVNDPRCDYLDNYGAKHPEYAPIGIAPASISSLTKALFPKETEADDWANGDTIMDTSTGITDTLAYKSNYNSSRWEMTSTTSEFFKSGNRYTKA